MDNVSILISAVCGDIGNSVYNILKSAGYNVFGCDMRPDGFINGCFTVPPASSSKKYLSVINEIIVRNDISIFIPISEDEIILINEHRGDLDSKVKIVINNELIINNFSDKYRTAEWFKKNNIKHPLTKLMCDNISELNYPIIIKPRRGCGSKKIIIANSHEDFLLYKNIIDEDLYIGQEYIGNVDDEYTTAIFSDGKNISNITFKRWLGAGGTTIKAELFESEYINNLSKKVATELKLKGSINIQTRRVNDIFYPFEINPRISSTCKIRKEFGFDDSVWWVDLIQGKSYEFNKKYVKGTAYKKFHEVYRELVLVDDLGGINV